MSREIKLLKVKSCNKHPIADTLFVIDLWQGTAVTIDKFNAGDFAVYMPAGSCPPSWMTKALGISKYLNNGKIKSVKLMGIQSNGALYSIDRIKKIALNSKRSFTSPGGDEYDKFINEKILNGNTVIKKKAIFSKFSLQCEDD